MPISKLAPKTSQKIYTRRDLIECMCHCT